MGLNVLPPFRGGNSTRLFTQLLRLYARKYKVERFEAENYQLGHQNPEGLRSGAYWFYYRRRVPPRGETHCPHRCAGIRTPAARSIVPHTLAPLMRELVSGALVLDITPGSPSVIDVGVLSPLCLRRLAERHRERPRLFRLPEGRRDGARMKRKH